MHKSVVIVAAGLIGLAAVALLIRQRSAPDEVASLEGDAPGSTAAASRARERSGGAEAAGELNRSGKTNSRPGAPGSAPHEAGAAGRGSTDATASETTQGRSDRAQAFANARRRAAREVGNTQGYEGTTGSIDIEAALPEGSGTSEKRPSRRDPGGSNTGTVADVVDVQPGEDGDAASASKEGSTEPVLTLFDEQQSGSEAEAVVNEGVRSDRDGALFNENSEFAVPVVGKLTGDAGTISFWVRPGADVEETTNSSLLQLRSRHEYENRLQLWQDGGKIRMVFADGSGTESGNAYEAPTWTADEWRQVTVTWGEGVNALYINGSLIGESKYEGGFNIKPDSMLHVGSNYANDSRSLNGAIQRVKVYDRRATSDEVAGFISKRPQ